MYEELYAPLPDLNAYLVRIGLAGCDLPPTAETLNKIIRAHLTHIPFENLDAWDRSTPPELGIPAAFDKIILHRRGGWCFELNSLLHGLLEALGFQVHTVGGRVMAGRDYFPPLSHHGEVCEVDGKRFYCDVGFGDTLFGGAVPLDGSISPYGFFAKRNGEYTEIWRSSGETPALFLMFIDRPFEPVDFIFANYVNSVKPGLPFHANLYVSLMTEDGHRKLLYNRRLSEMDGNTVVFETEAGSRSGISALLKEHFGIDYPLED